MTSQKVQIFALAIIAGCPTAPEISYFFALILLFLLLFQNSHVMYDSSCYILLSNSGTNGCILVCGVEVLKRAGWIESLSLKEGLWLEKAYQGMHKGEERYILAFSPKTSTITWLMLMDLSNFFPQSIINTHGQQKWHEISLTFGVHLSKDVFTTKIFTCNEDEVKQNENNVGKSKV